MPDYASNLRRLMARSNVTLHEVAAQSGLNVRTIKALLNGTNTKPHARTLHQLAAGFGVNVDELFQTPSLLAHRMFDRATNPIVDEVVAAEPQRFDGWSEADFDELYSRVGTGGTLTREGVIRAVASSNHKRDLWRKIALLLESGQADLLSGIVDLLYERVVVRE